MRDGLVLSSSSSSPGRSPALTRSLKSVDRWLGRLLQAALGPAGLRIKLWDGQPVAECASPVADVVIADRRALIGLIVNRDLHFGDAYMDGRVAIRGDLAKALENVSRLCRPGPPTLLERLRLTLAPVNDLRSARRNIHHHYDLGNDFYELWLDEDLLYTCACYPHPTATLEEAQRAKLDLICRKLRLQPGERVVEAGCGWGALALHMARQYGVTVRAFNISKEQIAYARDRAAKENLTSRVEFIEDDYRSIAGDFDVFVSIGMLEHVGRRQFSALAGVIRRCLESPGARGLLHFIGRDHPKALNAWIRRRIFPGAYPPTLSEVTAGVLGPANQSVLDVENLRLHYARTLEDWRTRFERAEPIVSARFGDAFARAWRLYLAGSEAAFRTGWLQLYQIVFAPAGGTTVHWLRPSHHDAHV